MDILLYVCAAISTVGAAITVIYNTASKAKQPWDSLMSRMMAVEAKLAEHDRHFASDLERIRAMEAENAEVLKALFALLSTVTPAQLPTFSLEPVKALYIVVLPEFGLPVKAILIFLSS